MEFKNTFCERSKKKVTYKRWTMVPGLLGGAGRLGHRRAAGGTAAWALAMLVALLPEATEHRGHGEHMQMRTESPCARAHRSPQLHAVWCGPAVGPVLRLAGGAPPHGLPPHEVPPHAAGAAPEGPVRLDVRSSDGGPTAQMHFRATYDAGQLHEIEAGWVGEDLSAPVESAEELLFLAASILGCDTRRSALWLARPAGRGGGRGSRDANRQDADAARPLRADSAAALWHQLVSAQAAKRALVVTDADATELVEDVCDPTQDMGAMAASFGLTAGAQHAPESSGLSANAAHAPPEPAPQEDESEETDKSMVERERQRERDRVLGNVDEKGPRASPGDDQAAHMSMAPVKVTATF